MSKSIIVYQADQEVIGKHLRIKEWIMYSGKLTIYNRKTNPIVLKLKSENYGSFIGVFMDDNKEFKGSSISDVLANYQNGITKMR